MNSFDIRKRKGKQLQDDIIDYLDENNINYILSGYEHLQGKGGHEQVKKNNDSTSLFIRHYPDISLIYNQISYLLEIKNSTGIEKECYNNYMTLKTNMDIDVLLYLRNKKICKIEDLQFQKANVYDKIANMKIPVTDEVWKEPRQMNSPQYIEYLNAYRIIGKYTSGCSFAFIDWKNTRFYDRSTLLNPEQIIKSKTITEKTLFDF